MEAVENIQRKGGRHEKNVNAGWDRVCNKIQNNPVFRPILIRSLKQPRLLPKMASTETSPIRGLH